MIAAARFGRDFLKLSAPSPADVKCIGIISSIRPPDQDLSGGQKIKEPFFSGSGDFDQAIT